MQTLEDYLQFLEGKGFIFGEDAIGFIYFGRHYTNASDELVNAAIEFTLKAQKRFDGSFYVSILEMFVANKIENRVQALQLLAENQILAK